MRTIKEGRWQDPELLAWQLALLIKPEDGCVDCGYSFGYDQEGCDPCAPFTEVLALVGLTHSDKERS